MAELDEDCKAIIKLLDEHLIPNSSQEFEAMVFYHKMKGDYYRYMAEYTLSDAKEGIAKECEQAYLNATESANELASTHPIKLGLALNFSVFYYEIKSDSKKACELAKEAFDSAIAELDHLKEESYKDSTLIMQLLRDNLTLWTSETEAEEN